MLSQATYDRTAGRIDGPFWLQLADVGIIWLAEYRLLYIECRCCHQRLDIDAALDHIRDVHNQSPTKGQWQQLMTGYGVSLRLGSQWATADQLSHLAKTLAPIQRVQPCAFLKENSFVTFEGLHYLRGPEWLEWAQVKVCLVESLHLGSLYCERCHRQFPISTIEEHVQEFHDVYEDRSFFSALRTQFEDYLCQHGWQWAKKTDMARISSQQQRNHIQPIAIVSMHDYRGLYLCP